MARSDAAWVDVLPQMKGFAAPLMKGVKDASKKAGTEGGRALVDGMNSEARKADTSPVVKQLEEVERAAKKTADEQAASAKKAASEVGKSQTRIVDARDRARTAAANVDRAEADLEKRRATAASKTDALERAEQEITDKRTKGEATADELAKAELDLAGKRADSAKADADVTSSTAKLETARTKLGQATEKVENEDTALRAAINESKSAHQEARDAASDHARAQEDLARETGEAAQEAEKAVPAWKRLWQGMDGTGGLKKRIVSGMKGIGREIEAEAGRIRSRGDALLSGIGTGVKWGAAGLAAGAAGFLGGAAVGGFNRLADLEDARASLSGLGQDAKVIDQVMKNVEDSVTGTTFSLSETATLGGTFLASGVKPGEDLTRVLSLVADSATIAKRDIGDMGSIWSSVKGKGKLQGDDAQQLIGSGIAIWEWVGDIMGKTAAEAQELGSKGKVSFEIFADAMEQNLGGAAKKSGDTVRGTFANMRTSVSRFGANLMTGVFPLFKPALQTITDWVNGLGDKLTPMVEKAVTGLQALFDLVIKGDFTSALTELFGWEEDAPIVDLLFRIRDGAMGIWDLLIDGDFSGKLRDAFGWEEDSAAVGMLFSLRDAAMEVGGWFRDNLVPILAGVGATLAYLGGSTVIGAIVSGFALVKGALVAAFAAIGWIPLAIGAAVGALTWFFTQTEIGQELWEKAWTGIQNAVSAVATWFTETAWPAILTGWDLLRNAAAEVIPVVIGYVQSFADYAQQVFLGVILPAFQQFTGFLQETVFPIVQRLWTDYVQPAFTAIGGAAVWLWHNAVKPALSAIGTFISETLAPTIIWLWQNVVSPAFSAIGSFIGWAWNSIIFPALDAFKGFMTNVVGPTIVWLWKNVVVPAWNGISWAIDTAWKVIQVIFAIIDWTIKNVVGPVFTWLYEKIIKPVWSGVQDTLEAGWTFVRDKVFTPLKNFIQDSVAPGFEKGVEAIGTAWDKLKGAAAKPVKFVIEDVINKSIISPFNTVAGWFDIDPVTELSVPASLKGYAGGGKLPGYTPYASGDDMLVPMRAGEGVYVSEAMRDPYELSRMYAVNSAALAGKSLSRFQQEGYAGGGEVKLRMPFNGSYPRGDGFGARSGRHKGIDWPMPTGATLNAVAAGKVSHTWNPAAGRKLELAIGNGLVAGYHHLSSFIADRGATVGAGAAIAKAGSTGRSSGPHLHFSLKRDGKYVDPLPYLGAGGAAGDGDTGWLNPFSGLWNSIQDFVREGVGDSEWGDVLFGMPRKLVGGAVDWAQDKIASIGDWFSGSDDGGSGGGGVDRWRGIASQALQMKSMLSPVVLNSLMRRMDQESGGNPSAVNRWDSNWIRGTPSKGLMQVIQPTFDAYAEPGYSSNILDPLSNILASINYSKATYGSVTRGWDRRGGYAGGGVVKPLVYDEGGWLKPGLSLVHNKSGVPEPVFTGKQGQSIIQMLESGGGSGTNITVPITATELSESDVDRLADEILRRLDMALEDA